MDNLKINLSRIRTVARPVRRMLAPMIVSALAMTLSACTTLDTRVTAELNASFNLNETNDGPRPVYVKIYELRDKAKMLNADFLTFEKDPAGYLGNDLIEKMFEQPIKPGDSQRINRTLSPDTRYLGVVVRYRDYENADWMKVVHLREMRPNRLKIEIGKRDLSVVHR